MATVNLNDLRVKNASNLLDSFNSSSNQAQAYMFIGRPIAWPTGDNNPPTPTNNYREFYNVYDMMLSLKRINDIDAFHMIRRNKWQAGVTYDIYNPRYSSLSKSFTGQANLYDSNYYVINSSNYIYVCLDNNGNSASTVEPQDINDDAFYTSDGYQWLKLYSLSETNLTEHATEDFLPIITESTNNVTTGTDGAVYTVIIDSPGNNYTSNPAGYSNQLPYYYCPINGDGTGGVAKVTLTLGRISQIEVIRNGSGYTEATLNFIANNVYGSLVDLDANINSLNPLGDGTFRSTVIVSPPGGWGSDIPRQLGGTRVGIFSTLTSSDFDFVEDITFRQIGVIQDPVLATSTTPNASTLSASYAICYTNMTGPGFTIGETISQAVEVDGVVRTAKGQVVNVDTNNNVVKFIQDPNLHRDLSDNNLYRFGTLASQSASVVLINGDTSGTTANPDTTKSGSFVDLYFNEGYAAPEIVKYSGYLTYLTNQSPITRLASQSERISLIIGY
jgi:hypothetical protein